MTNDKLLEKKRGAKNNIIRFLTKGDIVLTGEDEAILSRWEFADLTMRQGVTFTEALITRIVEKFGVSKFTADADITNAMEVFSKSRKLNRKYLGHLHLQDIGADLTRVRAKLFESKKLPDAKDLQALAKLHDAYTYQLNSLPEDIELSTVGRITMQFSLPAGLELPERLPLEEALKLADNIIDIDYEEIIKRPNMENREAHD